MVTPLPPLGGLNPSVPDVAQVLEQFRAALRARDIVPPEPIVADGCLHRCDAAGRPGRRGAAYLLHLDGIPAGQATARATAASLWAAAMPAPPDHPYLTRKGVQAFDLRVWKGLLLVPVRDLAEELHSLQFIGADGSKRFLRGGHIQGLGCWIGTPPGRDDTQSPILIVEGFATGASL